MKRSTVEIWVPVVGYEGLYEVSSWGRVRSLDREYVCSRGRHRTHRGRVLTPTAAKGGYLRVCISRNGRHWTPTVHRLVTEAFIGPRPEGLDIMHADDNPANNHLSNLSYGTRAENMRQCSDRGRFHTSRRTHCPSGHEYTPENTYITPKGGRSCRECGRERSRRYSDRVRDPRVGPTNKEKTHCPQGHPYSGDNLMITSGGGRKCRKCQRRYSRESLARKSPKESKSCTSSTTRAS